MKQKNTLQRFVKRNQRTRASGHAFIGPLLQRKCGSCEAEEKLQKKAEGPAGSASPALAHFVQGLPGKGSPMPVTQQLFFGKRLGLPLAGVKIHTGPDADAAARQAGALAFTIGQHIVFKQGEFNLQSTEGQLLLAHELVHVKQQQQGLLRKTDTAAEEKMEQPTTTIIGPVKEENTTHYGNCEGVSVEGLTNANYSNSFTYTTNPKPGKACSDCEPSDCISTKGNITSVFKASPTVSLPAVPNGLSKCETAAVGKFIATTLTNHENQHVKAFKTYNKIVTTSYNYSGCSSGLNEYVTNIHDDIETKRRAASDAASAKLDPFNVPIPCNCPDPVSKSETAAADE